MTRKEAIILILKDKKLTSSQLTDLFYQTYPNMVKEKEQSYVDKGVIKTKNEVKGQLRAEFISMMVHHSKKLFNMEKGIYSLTEIGYEYYQQLKNKTINGNNNEIKLSNSIIPVSEKIPEKILIHQVTTEDLNWKTLQVFKNEHGDIEFDIVENVGGYTYLLDEPVSKRVKIGYSKNPNGRIATHQTSNTNLEHIIVFPTSLYSERSLHQRFSSYRDIQCRAKEFFFRTKELDDFIKEELDKQENTLSFYDIHKEYAINKENFIKKLK